MYFITRISFADVSGLETEGACALTSRLAMHCLSAIAVVLSGIERVSSNKG